MARSLACSCGAVRATISDSARFNRAICYCPSCQAFAHFLGRPAEILDSSGGTDVLQTQPRHIEFHQGVEKLACVRLTDKGPLRWYTTCCRTPIGNTPANSRMSFIGLIHACLGSAQGPLDESYGPVQMKVFTKYAVGEPKPRPFGLAGGIVRVIGGLIADRLSGAYRRNPFFEVATHSPIKVPQLLTPQERDELYGRVRAT